MESLDGWMDGESMDRWIVRWMDVRVDGWMVLAALVITRVSVISGCFLLQGGWRSTRQNFHGQS